MNPLRRVKRNVSLLLINVGLLGFFRQILGCVLLTFGSEFRLRAVDFAGLTLSCVNLLVSELLAGGLVEELVSALPIGAGDFLALAVLARGRRTILR